MTLTGPGRCASERRAMDHSSSVISTLLFGSKRPAGKGVRELPLPVARRGRAFYDGFLREAAERGWVRLHLLELDGTLIAGSLVIAFGGEGFFLKTGFDESYAQLGPGVVLMAEMLRVACEEGLRGMDLLGRADQYKMRWTDRTRPRQRLRVYRGPIGRVAQRGWNGIAHPRLVALRDRARTDPQLRHQLERAQRLLDRRGRT